LKELLLIKLDKNKKLNQKSKMKKIIFTLLTICLFTSQVFAVTSDASLELKQENTSENNVTVSVYIQNPSSQSITSVQSWLKYDPNVLKGISIDANLSPFDFIAPGENTFDAEKGVVKIGRSSMSGGTKDNEIFVAKISFERISSKKTEVFFYNFKLDSSGNTSIRVFDDGFPVNILKENPASLIIDGDGSSVINKTNVKDEDEELTKDIIKRPSDLRITSGPEYAVLAWENDKNVKGYNVYYSNTSGRYLQRRAVGNVSEYYLEGLKTGEYYYFAITAYDNINKESDYSDEVRIKIGYPDSSSSPLAITKSQETLNKTKKHVDSGPAKSILFVLIISGITAFIFANRQKI